MQFAQAIHEWASKQTNKQTNKHQQKESNKNIITDQFQFRCRGFEIMVATRYVVLNIKILKSNTKPAGCNI